VLRQWEALHERDGMLQCLMSGSRAVANSTACYPVLVLARTSDCSLLCLIQQTRRLYSLDLEHC
jgi:hypothetical protein